MMNLKKTAEEIRRLRELVANQKNTIEKSMQVIDQLIDENMKLKDENKQLHTRIRMLCDAYTFSSIFDKKNEDVIFPNTDERGLGDGDTPIDLSPLDL